MAIAPAPIKDPFESKTTKGFFAPIWTSWFEVIRRALNSTASDTVTVVSAIQAGGAGALGFQYKTRALTISNGVTTTIGTESAWNDL